MKPGCPRTSSCLCNNVANEYADADLLPLSGIQHLAFCERQWALIHVENQWVENVRTAEGRNLHQRVDDPYFAETRGEVKSVRSVPLVSRSLGLYGVADVIELQKVAGGSTDVRYRIIEYKRGKPKPDDRDEVQLCAQAICLEEMLSIYLDCGYLYYGETKHRHRVELANPLRMRVRQLAERMHVLFVRGETPPPVKDKRCNSCSLAGVCVPKLAKSRKPEEYLRRVLDEMKSE